MTSSQTSNTPWVEKYRPNTIDDVVYQEEVVKALKKSLESHEFPHLLFYGPPGTGKTSTILAVAKQLFGPELFKSRVLELNASDERGINVVRTKVKTFAQNVVASKPADYPYPCPPFKLLILDEADSMTPDAQAALRRIMEAYSKVTRFCIICNYITRIIDPLASRCAKFRFKPLEKSLVVERLKNICKEEKLTISAKGIDQIIDVSEGDLRRAITLLQSSFRMYGAKISEDNIVEISGIIPESLIAQFYKAACSNDISQLQAACTKIHNEGYSVGQLLSQLHDYLISVGKEKKISDKNLSFATIKIAETEKYLLDGGDEQLQLLALGSFIMRVIHA